MPMKKSKPKEATMEDNEMMIRMMEQISILAKSIKDMDSDISTLYDKVERACKRLGI